MNRLVKAGVLAGMSGTVYLGAIFTGEGIRYSPEEYNPKVEACAAQLGRTALEVSALPATCSEFSDSFNSAQVRGEAIYTVPSAKLFRLEHLITPEEEARNKSSDRILGGVGAALAAGLGAFILREPRSRNSANRQIARNT